MIGSIFKKILGTQNERALRRLNPLVDRINSFESSIQKLSDDQLKSKTEEFREKIRQKISQEKPQNSKEERLIEERMLDEILPEAFAVVRETARRTIGLRHHNVQLIGGIALHRGMVTEMANGEGKTLVATLTVYLNALTKKGAHVVTVNDYLARRDREWMGPVYEFLGLSIGAIQHDMPQDERRKAYMCDITYGTINEFGFDYLRDNMVIRREDMAQRGHHYTIVDEVDSILIDEARTPLIISGPAEESTDKYYKVDKIIPQLKKGERDEATKEETGDYIIDEKAHTAYLTEQGELKAARLLGLDSLHTIETMEYKHHINQALKAHQLFKKDKDYVIKDDEVIIVDEFTGRLMTGRRWSEGLHQAVEAKEKVKIERENQTLATVTFQNYFRMYKKLAGMTGTAVTEAVEFQQIYKLDVLVIPTNKPVLRKEFPDIIYKTEQEKLKAIVEKVMELHKKQQPALVGTISIEKSEILSDIFKRRGIPHNVLNAKHHEKEAYIIAQAGRLKAVTIATNMAGRGTDIRLGGNPEFMTKIYLKQQGINIDDLNYQSEYRKEYPKFNQEAKQEHEKVKQLGGLYVIGTERHESRRIDNQLRGRAGRQGASGCAIFYLSLGDDLLRIFGSDKITRIYDRLGIEEGQQIQHSLVARAIETAQRRVEAHNFEIRKQLLRFDNVMNKQRETIYEERRKVLLEENLKKHIFEIIGEVLDKGLEVYLDPEVLSEEWDIRALREFVKSKFLIDIGEIKIEDNRREQELYIQRFGDELLEKIKEGYVQKEKRIGKERTSHLEKMILLQIIDSRWKDHLYAMDNLKEGIGLRAYGQRDPLVEYQHEGYAMFTNMVDAIKEETVEFLFKVQAIHGERFKGVFEAVPQQLLHPETAGLAKKHAQERGLGSEFRQSQGVLQPSQKIISTGEGTYVRKGRKVGRNEPCTCGSGKKYKKCCGK